MPVVRRLARGWAAALAAAVPSLCLALAAPPSSGDTPDAPLRRLEEARALQRGGSLREAQRRFESVIADLRGRDRPADLGSALVGLSQIATALGEYDRATARGREAAEAYRAAGNEAGESRALNATAVAEVYRGEIQRGLADLERALSLSRAAGDREAEVEQLNNTGAALSLHARYLDALRAYRDAEGRVDAARDAPWHARWRRITVSNLAALFQQLGAYERALELYRSLQTSPEALTPNEQARVLANQGALYRRLEDPVKALEAYSAAERLFKRERHLDGEIGVLKNVGIVQALDLGDLSAALETFSGALALAERNHDRRETMQAHLYRGETLLRLGDARGARRDLEAALASAAELQTTEERWKALYALGRVDQATGRDDLAVARFRQAIAAIESVRSKLQISSLKTDFLADKRDVYDALVGLLAEHPDAAEIFGLMERSRARTFQDRLQEGSAGGDAKEVALAAVQARLDRDTLLLEYWVSPNAAAVVWLTHEGSGFARIPSPPTAVDVSSFEREVSSGTGDAWKNGARMLGERLLSAVEPLRRPGVRHLVVVPDGSLSALPFEVLEIPGGDGARVIERFDVSYLPSASFVLRDPPPAWRSWSFPWTRRLVAFGDPVFPAAPGGALPEPLGADASRLPASAEEVRAIASMVGGRTEVHLGTEDRKAFLLRGQARGVALLHLSTHATADDANPERSRILFSPGAEEGRADYLFLKEVYDLDLRGVDLTTLSACDTERGKVIRGEGLQAFSRALLSAGSRATVTALWRVTDRPTAELMRQFYFELRRGAAKAEALRLAKLRFLRSGGALAHPRFWAAFVLGGDGLRPVPRAFAWRDVVTPIAALLLVAAALVIVRR